MLGSIGPILDDDDLITYTLNGLKDDDKWKGFTTSIYGREHLPDFDQLVSLMVTEEMNLQSLYPKGNQLQVLYAGSRGRGRFGRGQQGRGRGRGRFNDFQHHEREESQNQNHRGELRGRGKQRGRAQGRWSNNRSQNNCYICGKFGHYAQQCCFRNNNKLQ